MSNIDIKETRLFALRALKEKILHYLYENFNKINLRREFAVGTVTIFSQNI